VSPTAATTASRGGRVAVTVIGVAVVAVVMLAVLRARPGSAPFDPESGRPDGTRGLVLLLRQQRVTVDVIHQPPTAGDAARVLVLEDRLDDGQRTDLEAWVRAGGVVVVADPSSPLVGSPPTNALRGDVPPDGLDARSQANLLAGTCTIDALDALRGVFVRDGVVYDVASTTARCFDDDVHGAFAFTRPLGDGVIVALGDNALFTNALLRYADNGPLATALLAPQPGGSVHVLVGRGPSNAPADIGSGDETLADLVRPGVWMALVQLALAFVVFAIARGIRPGRPVDEPTPVPVEGSELVAATGQLMQRAHHASRAGWILRAETYRQLCAELGVAPTTSIADLDALAARRSLTAPGEVAAALDHDVATASQLVALSNRLADLRTRTDSSGAAPPDPIVARLPGGRSIDHRQELRS
jgi:hypothetical protein